MKWKIGAEGEVSLRGAATLPFPACNTIFNGAPWKMSARKIVIKWGRNLYKFYLRALSECVCVCVGVALAWLMLLIKKAFFHGNLFTLRNIRCRRQIVEIIFIVGNARPVKMAELPLVCLLSTMREGLGNCFYGTPTSPWIALTIRLMHFFTTNFRYF